MSVTFDGPNRLIRVNSGITQLDVRIDLYSNWKEWMVLADNAKFLPAFSAIGGDEIAAGRFLGSTYFMENGWRIKLWEGNHALNVNGNIFSRDGSNPFVQPDGNFTVVVNTTRSNLVDTISTAGSAQGANSQQIAAAVWSALLESASATPGSVGEHVRKNLFTKLDNFALG
ncbi:MAG: hypothetical protein DDT26_00327 [Dehalococcoidia bacterium]|nr:hypothetical protein [Chloroflexota bacterium]